MFGLLACASGEIGRATVRLSAAIGARIVVIDRDADSLARFRDLPAGAGDPILIDADVTEEAEVIDCIAHKS